MATDVKIQANIESKSHSSSIGEKSLKSLRTYQVGVVYKDKYGRETPVFTGENSTFTIDKNASDSKNSIVTSLQNDPPSWADSYKFFVKETSNEYYNACMDRWYDAEDGNIWLSFPSAERNKIQEDTFLILKKPSDSNKAVHEKSRYRVIDIQNEAPDFIKTDYEPYGEDTLTVLAADPGSTTIKFDMAGGSNDWDDSVFYDSLLIANTSNPSTDTGFIGWPLEDVVIKLKTTTGNNHTNWLDVAGMYKDTDLFVKLSKPLLGADWGDDDQTGSISSILPTGAGDVSVKIAKKVVKNKPEFDGRFFVKIAKDAIVEEYVRSVGNPLPSFNVTNSVQQYYINRSQAGLTNAQKPDKQFWKDVGQRWYIDEAKRQKVGTGSGTGSGGPYPQDYGFGLKGDQSGKRSSGQKPSLRCTMELSLNKVKDNNKAGFDISNNTQANQDFLSKMSSIGTLFRWKEDPFQIIYKITGVQNSLDGNTNGDGIYNYGNTNGQKKETNNKTARLYLKFKTTGWRLDNDQDNSGTYRHFEDEEGLYPFKYKNQYTPQQINNVTWDPTMYGYGDYNNVSAGSYSANYDGPSNASVEFGDPLGGGNTNGFTASVESGDIFANTIQIIETSTGDEEPAVPKNPAIWETEPREDVGLEIYHEASQAYPINLNNKTNELFAPYGCEVTCNDKRVFGGGTMEARFHIPENTVLYDWAPTGHGGDTILLNIKTDEVGYIQQQLTGPAGVVSAPTTFYGNFQALNTLLRGIELRFTKTDGSYTTAKVRYFSGWFNGNVDPNTGLIIPGTENYFIDGSTYTGNSTDRVLIKLNRDLSKMNIKLPYFNCYSFGNGVESDRIRDDFNAVTLGKGVKVSTVLDEPYEEEQRTNGLIYSGIYNSNSGINNLNQFIAAEKITKDVNPNYGSIQKLKARDTDLVTFCEDKILKIVSNKDALYNADGDPQLISTNKVLGNTTSFAGEFGISKNPESYAEDAFRMYFTDKQRGKVLRLSGDGVTPISSVGMKDYFFDNLKENQNLIGSFDDKKGEYNLTLKEQNVTVAFSEEAKGWTSFKSFVQDNGLSINNEYYTIKNGEIWRHHDNTVDRNNFYGQQYDSHVDVLFNEESATVKSFGSMKYEGSQAKITQNLTDGEYYNNIGKDGWYVEYGETDLQEAGQMEFKSKEGKWFSHMKGKPVIDVKDLNSKEFSFQGIDVLSSITTNTTGSGSNGESSNGGTGTGPIYGCTDPAASNYDPLATIDDGSCAYLPPAPILGCTDPTATNYDPNATQDDGSCTYQSNSFTITVQDIGDQDPVVGNI